MFSHKLKVTYFGKNYSGWQKQKDTKETVQGKIEQALEKIFKEKIQTMGSGRTDAGVHALEQFVFFTPPFIIELDSLVRAINTSLPADIRATFCETCDVEVHPTISAKTREYRYLFTNDKQCMPITANLLANISFDLNFESMSKACKLFVGEHNFSSFYCTGSEIRSTIRTIHECYLEKVEASPNGIFPEHYMFVIKGSGFLKQMVRLLVGTMWEIGKGRTTLDELELSLKSDDDRKLGVVAPANGLYKFKVDY